MSEDSCPNCGYCKHCGRSDKPAYVPAPVPHYPMFPVWPSYPTWEPTITWGSDDTTGNAPFTFRPNTTSHM